jgi:hypothetical protein
MRSSDKVECRGSSGDRHSSETTAVSVHFCIELHCTSLYYTTLLRYVALDFTAPHYAHHCAESTKKGLIFSP